MSIDVPTLDLAADDRIVAAALDAACSSIGFLQVVNHGVSEQLRRGVLSASDAFFDLPLEQKLALRPPSPAINRGYAPSRSESLSYSLGQASAPDLFEALNFGVEDRPAGDPYYESEREG